VVDELSWEEHELLARIAHKWYIEEHTQSEIGRELGLSRPKVQRLLERARSTGVVDIRVEAPPGLDLEVEARLTRDFGLKEVIISPAAPDAESQRAAVARRAAAYLERNAREGVVIAVSHGRETGAVPRFFRPTETIACTFASAMGGSPKVDTPTNPNEIARAFAERCGGRSVSVYAPAYVETPEVRDRLMEQEAIADAIRTAAQADIALIGIGAADDECTMVRSGCLSLGEIARLREQGAVGDVLGNYVDLDGRLIAAPHSGRLVALSLQDLQRIPIVVAVASGAEKPLAILGVLRADIVDVLVIDSANARTVVDLARQQQ
jgi:DNA-binding transcriptional regulator LsrR (DeoR family)